MGEATWDFGALVAWRHKLGRKVNFRVQLNIQNLLNETDPLLTAVDTDTNAVFGTAHAEVPVYYTLRRPRNFVLSTTFEF
jgi:outer membrane receptor protein involved in Fe transport